MSWEVAIANMYHGVCPPFAQCSPIDGADPLISTITIGNLTVCPSYKTDKQLQNTTMSSNQTEREKSL